MEVGLFERQVLWWLILFLADLFKVIIIIYNFEYKFVFPLHQFWSVFWYSKTEENKCFGLFHQSLNSCGWLLEIDILNRYNGLGEFAVLNEVG